MTLPKPMKYLVLFTLMITCTTSLANQNNTWERLSDGETGVMPKHWQKTLKDYGGVIRFCKDARKNMNDVEGKRTHEVMKQYVSYIDHKKYIGRARIANDKFYCTSTVEYIHNATDGEPWEVATQIDSEFEINRELKIKFYDIKPITKETAFIKDFCSNEKILNEASQEASNFITSLFNEAFTDDERSEFLPKPWSIEPNTYTTNVRFEDNGNIYCGVNVRIFVPKRRINEVINVGEFKVGISKDSRPYIYRATDVDVKGIDNIFSLLL